MTRLIYRADVYSEGDLYVGRCPELDVSSFGDTPDEANDSLQEAVEAFPEGCETLGTLQEVLHESGFVQRGDVLRLRERITEERAAVLP